MATFPISVYGTIIYFMASSNSSILQTFITRRENKTFHFDSSNKTLINSIESRKIFYFAMSEWSFVEIFLLPSVLPLDTYKLMSLTIAGNKFTVS